ncbi:hypothetical protein [Roseovarius sp. M141]|uniref:hypothetical protein n=1 Tax=Roseovarius sp. M141 TaxID=2583806 RepID=UPI0020CE6229|nr:hypothetical protein [Roseovarius sp. M141]MCQ0092922.1 hypothetical protein [Roseovarius sp. M141]
MEGQLPTALGKLHAQLKRTLEEKQAGEVDHAQVARLAKEIEDVAVMLGAARDLDIGPTDGISTYWLGPAPTHCEACGQRIRKR